jgi:Zn-dependent protease with chaperone function
MNLRTTAMMAGCVALAGIGGGAADRFNGYAEFKQPGAVIVDGQQITAGAKAGFKGCTAIDAIALGVGVKVDGKRLANGAVEAQTVECEAWVVSPEEQAMITDSNDAEKAWVQMGRLAYTDGQGDSTNIGALLKDGPEVKRVQAIVARLAPAYVGAATFRTYVVDTKEWNAMVMPNGAVFVYKGLLTDLDDQEMAIILGHEIAHYTHHHSAKGATKRKRNSMIGGAIGAAGQVAGATGAAGGTATQIATSAGSGLVVTALNSGYGRDMEDQADRVGLRYAFRAGYDVNRAPALWQRFLDKYGQESALTNFFFSDHSRASTRKKNLQEQIAWNYAGGATSTATR